MNTSHELQPTADAAHPKTVITKKDRRLQLAKLFVIALVSIVTVVLTVIDVVQTAKSFEKKHKLNSKIQGSIETALVIHYLQTERGLTASQFGFNQLNDEKERQALEKVRIKTNESIVNLEKREDTDLSSLSEGSTLFQNVLENFRRKIDNGESNVTEHLQTYRVWITKIISAHMKFTESENLEDFASLFYSYEMLILSKEESAMERALGGLIFTQRRNASILNLTWYNEKRILAENYLKTGLLFSLELRTLYSFLFQNTSHWMADIERKRKILTSVSFGMVSNETAQEWFEAMKEYNNRLFLLQKQQAQLIETNVKDKISRSTRDLWLRSLLLCFTLVVVPLIIVSLAKVQKHFYDYTLSLFDKVALEQGRTDFLMRENARYVDNLQERWKGFSKSASSRTSVDGIKNHDGDNK